jgi:hypothetical protein
MTLRLLSRASACCSLAILSLAAGNASAAEPRQALRIVTAGDLAAGPVRLELPRAATYEVWAWAPVGETWWMNVAAGEITIRAAVLSPRFARAQRGVGWGRIGRMKYDPKAPPTIKIGPPRPEVADGGDVLPPLLAFRSVPNPDDFLEFFTANPAGFEAPLDTIRGRIDSVDPVVDPRRTTSRTRNEGANFRTPPTRQAWLDRAEHVRTQVRVALGLWPFWPRTELNPQVYGKLDRDGYTIEKVVLETLPGFTLAGNLYRPKGKTGRLPLVLCPHGHWKVGRVQEDVQSRCIWLAKRLSCVVFMYDMVGYNDSEPFGHAFLNDRLRRWGLSLASLQTWNSIRALDWALTLPDVDPARVGMTGESGGGTQTFLLTALDPRIKVTAPVVMVSHKMQGGCVCENCAGLRIGTDNVEIAALAAPRPMKLVGANDWTDETLTFEYPTLMGVYALLGSPDRLSADKFEFEHNYNQTSRNAVYAFLAKWLVGLNPSVSTREEAVKPEKPEDLVAYDKDHPAPSDRKTPEQLETELVAMMVRTLAKLAPTTVSSWWEAERDLLRKALEVRVGLVEPAPLDLATTDVRKMTRDGVTIAHSVVTWVPAGHRVPVVRLTPRSPSGRATVLFSSRGKVGLLGGDGKPSMLVKALLDRGQSVVGFDPLFAGEALDPRVAAAHRPTVDHFDCYNPSLAADRAQDLATVLAWTRSRPDLREVSLIAPSDSGPLALLARPMLTGLARTAIHLGGFEEGDGSGPVPAGLDLPGSLQFGGLKAAAALSAPAPLWLLGVPEGFAKEWPVKAYGLVDAGGMLKVDGDGSEPAALARWIDGGE